MKIFGHTFQEWRISLFCTAQEKGQLAFLEQKIAQVTEEIARIKEEQNASFFNRSIAPLISSLSNRRFCASFLPELNKQQRDLTKELFYYKQGVGKETLWQIGSMFMVIASQAAIFAVQRALLASALSPLERAPPIQKPEAWDKFDCNKQLGHIADYLQKNNLNSEITSVNSTEEQKKVAFEKLVKPLLDPNAPLKGACRAFAKQNHPDQCLSAQDSEKTAFAVFNSLCKQ